MFRKMCLINLLATLTFIPFMTLNSYAFKSELVELKTRPNITQKFIFIKPTKPIAAVILFEGGKGVLKLNTLSGEPSVDTKMATFLVEKREDFAKKGLMVALVDAPSDMTGTKLGRQDFLKGTQLVYDMSPELAQDIDPIISFLKNEADVPVWLVGISRGSFSAVTTAIFAEKKLNGLVLLSSETNIPKKWFIYKSHPQGILNMDLEKINVPTLILAHKNDKCDLTPMSAAPIIKQSLIYSPKTEVMYFEGGDKPRSGPCNPKSPHAFYGIEDEIITTMVDFITNNS